jgi:hypothetical protein
VYNDINEGEVLWITPDLYLLPERPQGFALLVTQLLGKDYDRPLERRVYVAGPVVLDTRGTRLRDRLMVSVPVDQPRAVPQRQAALLPPEPPRAVGTARPVTSSHQDEDRDVIQQEGRTYRRREMPGQ